MTVDRLTFKSFKGEKSESGYLKPSPAAAPLAAPQPPKQSLVRLSKVAFQFSMLANLALSAYIFVRAKQRDEAKRTAIDRQKGPPSFQELVKHEPELSTSTEPSSS